MKKDYDSTRIYRNTQKRVRHRLMTHPLYFFSAEFFFSQIFLRERVLAHRFHRYTQIFFIMIFLHRISRRNRRHSCLSDYSRNFAEFWPLTNGLRPIYAPVVFCHADFADDADFSSWGLFCPTDFTDLHRFFMESLVNLFVQSQGVSATTGQVASAKIRE